MVQRKEMAGKGESLDPGGELPFRSAKKKNKKELPVQLFKADNTAPCEEHPLLTAPRKGACNRLHSLSSNEEKKYARAVQLPA